MRRIVTENSVYLLDEEAGTVTRAESTHEMRRDGQAVRLVEGIRPTVRVGEAAVFWLEGLSPDSAITVRHTSTVLSVEEVR